MTTPAKTGINTAVTYKWLMIVVGPVASALFGAVVWLQTAALAPVEQRTQVNARRLDRTEERIERRLDRIEQKIDRLLERRK